MNILHLKYVVCIAETGSINKAAEELHVAQPNLSRVVREMETDLGICFFRRSSRGMLLTPEGNCLSIRPSTHGCFAPTRLWNSRCRSL